ncbi:vitamin B6 photo-protection and homoeostasis-domain-containing protein [Gymnopilus junonius]|uniref:Vitamin B6 photo-protection and homoeostasis-domain-containing protein n=1 Tax=Gymnopilus junonius TaxID=109634 RepID=A0A9P5NEP4_GYMJU|nr:vitamin B6 photo-protection and homoeostasis-domain-containing protein [Gymnopilus junonius]
METIVIQERDEVGRHREIFASGGKIKTTLSTKNSTKGTHHAGRVYFVDLLTKMFLPAGYPNTVSPDYLRYQVLNALQAFCNSLASLLSARATLQGFGVGNPDATPTQAMLLTVLQDACGRLATILSAHFIGSSLYPEAKTYRLLADILNDTSVVIDTLSPILIPFPVLRIGALCVSAVFKALCGISAGGSKAAITLHFATPLSGKGDVGDLNAKDASKETVLALFGMLLGTLIVPYLSTSFATYTTLFMLIGLHLGINYVGVRGLTMRSLNRGRLGLAWLMYRASKVPTPSQIAGLERIFDLPGAIRDPQTGRALGRCTIGSSFSKVLRRPLPRDVLKLFAEERYIIWFDHQCIRHIEGPKERADVRGFIGLHIFLKESYTASDQLRAWIHAVELCRVVYGRKPDELDTLDILQEAYDNVTKLQSDFLQKLLSVGWNITDYAILAGSPTAVVTGVSLDNKVEEKKAR